METVSVASRDVKSSGLTLIELLVVLSILAVLSTVALRSVVGTLEQNNYDANISQLEQIELAVLGDQDSAGFVGDIGRLPVAVGAANDSTNFSQLGELWDLSLTRDVVTPANALLEYSIRIPSGDPEVSLGTGWRGPYLNLGIDRNELSDGFANRFLLYQANGGDSNDGDPVAIIQSLGADGGSTGTGTYDQDLEVVFQADAGAVTAGLADAVTNPDLWQKDLVVTVRREDGASIEVADGNILVVRAYGADGTTGGVHTVSEGKFTLTGNTSSRSFTLSDLPHGAKVLRAYQDTTDPADKDTAITTDRTTNPGTPERNSPATHIVIDQFTNGETLILY